MSFDRDNLGFFLMAVAEGRKRSLFILRSMMELKYSFTFRFESSGIWAKVPSMLD